MTPSEFASKLNNGVYNMEFTKLDGAIRNMIATRMADKIPEDQQPKKGWTVVDDTVTAVAVFDLQVCGWRSVRPESVISMNVVATESV